MLYFTKYDILLVMNEPLQQKLEDFFSKFTYIKFRKGKLFYQPNDPITDIFFIKEGLVKQYILSENGEELTLNIFRPNSFFPIMLVLANQPNKYFFQAETDIVTFKAPTKEVLEFLEVNPDILLDLTKRFAAAILGLSIRVEELSFHQAQNRVYSLLLYLAEKFGETKNGKTVIKLLLTHQDLASWTSLTRETVSRQLEQLSKQGVINYSQQSITILDKNRLLAS